jgi:hypothetical protein
VGLPEIEIGIAQPHRVVGHHGHALDEEIEARAPQRVIDRRGEIPAFQDHGWVGVGARAFQNRSAESEARRVEPGAPAGVKVAFPRRIGEDSQALYRCLPMHRNSGKQKTT